MTRNVKMVLGASLATLMLLGTAAAAFAAPALTLSATRNVVTYPQPTWLKVNAADEGAEGKIIQVPAPARQNFGGLNNFQSLKGEIPGRHAQTDDMNRNHKKSFEY